MSWPYDREACALDGQISASSAPSSARCEVRHACALDQRLFSMVCERTTTVRSVEDLLDGSLEFCVVHFA
jgi:hypothetical protein